jgi:hypothetical protein
MKKLLIGFIAGLLLAGSAAIAANVAPIAGQIFTSPVVVSPSSIPFNGGPQTSAIFSSGGTFTCTSSGTITVTDSYVDANSVFLFGTKTANSPAAFTVSAVTVGTSFAVTCGSGDTSVYNYWVLG